jgi:uncharacterized lipoprotein YajG
MVKLRSIAVLLLSLALVSACAFTDSTLKVDYNASKHAKISVSADKINVVKFTDQRGVEPALLAHKGAAYRTSGKYYSDKDVASVVTDATKALLAQLGYTVVDDAADFRLSGDLLKFDSQVAVGFWSGTLDGSAQLNLKLTDAKNGSIMWNEMLAATAKKEGLQIDADDHRKEVADMLLDELMNKLAASSTFKEALSKRP